MNTKLWTVYNKDAKQFVNTKGAITFFNSRKEAREIVRTIPNAKVVRASISFEHRLHNGTWSPLT